MNFEANSGSLRRESVLLFLSLLGVSLALLLSCDGRLPEQDVDTMMKHATTCFGNRQFDSAATIHMYLISDARKQLGTRSSKYGTLLVMLAWDLQELGREREADSLFLRGVSILAAYPVADSLRAWLLCSQGQHYMRKNRLSEAEKCLTESLDIRKRLFGGSHPEVAVVLEALSDTYVLEGDHAKGLLCLESAIDLSRRIYGATDSSTLRISNHLATLYVLAKRYNEYEALTRRVLFDLKSEHPIKETVFVEFSSNLGKVYAITDRNVDASRVFSETLGYAERVLGRNRLEFAEYLRNYSIAQQLSGKRSEGLDTYSKIMKMVMQNPGVPDSIVADHASEYAAMLRDAGNKEKARYYQGMADSLHRGQ